MYIDIHIHNIRRYMYKEQHPIDLWSQDLANVEDLEDLTVVRHQTAWVSWWDDGCPLSLMDGGSNLKST